MNNLHEPVHHPPQSARPGAEDGHLDFLSGERGEEEFARARQHSRYVRLLKLGLPIVGVMIIAGFVGALVFQKFAYPSLDIGTIALEDGKLVMENPNLSGVDENKRPFSLSAEKAIQDADQPKRVELITINAQLPMENAVTANITAGNGIYDAEAKTLILSESVKVETSDGMRIELQGAEVDIGEGSLRTDNPITATSKQADISSQSLIVGESGERLIFEGKVRMTLRPKALKEARNAND